jgi:flagellar hook-length control protein FliK
LPVQLQNDAAMPSSPESEVEIQLSQPQPVIARLTAAPALAENLSASLGRPQVATEQQIEKIRMGNEKNVVKEMAQPLQVAASTGESMTSSDDSLGGDNSQQQPDAALGNKTLAQDMVGTLTAEHQKVSAVAAKPVSADPIRQEFPEQVMHQVKDRLLQHDVKPGNQQITLTLSPDSLGELKMNLNLQGQKLSVEIVTENRAVRDAIVQHTDALKESLARQNITMESFDVTTGGKGSGGQGQNPNAWRELAKQQQQQQFYASSRGYTSAEADLLPGLAPNQKRQGQSMLDIHY